MARLSKKDAPRSCVYAIFVVISARPFPLQGRVPSEFTFVPCGIYAPRGTSLLRRPAAPRLPWGGVASRLCKQASTSGNNTSPSAINGSSEQKICTSLLRICNFCSNFVPQLSIIPIMQIEELLTKQVQTAVRELYALDADPKMIQLQKSSRATSRSSSSPSSKRPAKHPLRSPQISANGCCAARARSWRDTTPCRDSSTSSSPTTYGSPRSPISTRTRPTAANPRTGA